MLNLPHSDFDQGVVSSSTTSEYIPINAALGDEMLGNDDEKVITKMDLDTFLY